VVVDAAVHRANQTNVVSDVAQCGEQFAQLHATLAAVMKLPRAAEQLRAGAGGIVVLDVARVALLMMFG
jgi:hypothetical protein